MSFTVCNLYATDILDGSYTFRSTVKEASTNEQYPFKMNLNISNNHIIGDIDYFNDGCLGVIKGEVLQNKKIQLFETITKGSDICANGTYVYDLKNQIISKASHYTLENNQHSVTINKYEFTPNSKTWNNVILKDKIAQKKVDIDKLENDINITRQFIKESKQSEEQSKQYLENNTTLVNGECTKPPLETTPEPLFDTEEKSKKYALAYCSISFGCRIGVELAGNKLDTFSKRFLASQSCSLLVKDFFNKNILLKETMFNLLESVSYTGCNGESDDILSAVMQGGSCIMSAATRLARIGQYIHCIDYKTKEFHNSYLDWKDKPEKIKKECDTHLKNVDEAPKKIDKYSEEISKIENEIVVKNAELEQLGSELKGVLLLREKQSKLIKELTR